VYVCTLNNKEAMEPFIILGIPGPWQVILIVLVVLLLFGGRKIPELMKGLGQGMKEFKKATKDEASKEEEQEKEKEIEKK
jgi:sec-independent protein translocase protein TatA